LAPTNNTIKLIFKLTDQEKLVVGEKNKTLSLLLSGLLSIFSFSANLDFL